MALLRYAAQEARNIAKAQTAAEQQAKVDAFVQARKAAGGVTKGSIGLGNVDNTSDADKPISSATLAALNGKEPVIVAGTTGQYWRGDKSWQIIAINDVNGLSSSLSGLSAAAAAKLSIPAITTIATDAAATVTPSVTYTQVFHTGTLTAARTITLTTAGQTTGSVIRFTRAGSGAFNLNIGALKALATNTWCDVIFNGTAWVLTAYGTL